MKEGDRIDWACPPIHTSSWRRVFDHVRSLPGGSQPAFLPVRISLGKPRFWKGANELPYVSELMPHGDLFKIEDRGEFTEAFIVRLDRYGADRIRGRFAELGSSYRKPLVLMCFELCEEPDDWCHRQVFAEWWQARTGQHVSEVTDLEALA
jgi:hypothetical protein